jgi:DNA methylase
MSVTPFFAGHVGDRHRHFVITERQVDIFGQQCVRCCLFGML